MPVFRAASKCGQGDCPQVVRQFDERDVDGMKNGAQGIDDQELARQEREPKED